MTEKRPIWILNGLETAALNLEPTPNTPTRSKLLDLYVFGRLRATMKSVDRR